jgi:hypothetical protein
LIDKTRRQPSEKNTWAKAAARLTVKRQAAVLDINEAITTTTLVEVRPLAGGSSHLQEATRDHRNPQDLPIEDLRQKINEGRDARSIIDSRGRERKAADPEGTNCSDRFPAFTAWLNSYKYPEGFKPIGITKDNGKQAPQQWLRCYSTAIEVAGSSNTTKVVYFPMALDPASLTWLESLSNNSIDSWEGLKKVFIDNF